MLATNPTYGKCVKFLFSLSDTQIQIGSIDYSFVNIAIVLYTLLEEVPCFVTTVGYEKPLRLEPLKLPLIGSANSWSMQAASVAQIDFNQVHTQSNEQALSLKSIHSKCRGIKA